MIQKTTKGKGKKAYRQIITKESWCHNSSCRQGFLSFFTLFLSSESVKKKKVGHFIMRKSTGYNENITVINLYAPNSIALRVIK